MLYFYLFKYKRQAFHSSFQIFKPAPQACHKLKKKIQLPNIPMPSPVILIVVVERLCEAKLSYLTVGCE